MKSQYLLAVLSAALAFVASGPASAEIVYRYKGSTVVKYHAGDTVAGTAKNEIFVGTFDAGSASVAGGDGKDSFWAALQLQETFTGGAGPDRFVFGQESSEPYSIDQISDFNRDEGDKIDLRFIDANTKKPGMQTFVYRGSGPFVGPDGYAAAGQLRFADGYLIGDTNGALDEPEFVVKIDGVDALKKSDFIVAQSAAAKAKAKAEQAAWRKVIKKGKATKKK
jgi:Ca2+-binding RTX toxin-like protein